ncbi:hypothetical protein [Conexibacter sp. SYSU D00693]|uniref:hypothetical protein n=1 Tax=Conexibacter sp. SYSU D00693 TaxID=2812560 RepID=UPI00196B3371|nr:hypothetical protein [Conexibacter sp. SYSU D00693]
MHRGYHDWPNFRDELREAIAWGLFEPVAETSNAWVNDTVATHGRLWELAYRFDAPPERVVRFRRRGDTLSVSSAGAPVTITTAGGCVLRVATPGQVEVPGAPCARLSLRARPRVLRAGRPTRLRAAVTPAVAGVRVQLGEQRATTDDRGVAILRVCVSRPGRRKVRGTREHVLPAVTHVRAVGRRARCAT